MKARFQGAPWLDGDLLIPSKEPREFARHHLRSCLSLATAFAALLTLLAVPVSAATLTWTGGSFTSGNWSDSANWGYAGVPANGDTLIFPAGSARSHNTNNIQGLVFYQIVFQGPGGGYSINGYSFTLTNGILANNTAGGNTINNAITFSTIDQPISVNSGVSLTLAGALSGTVGITKSGVGTLRYSGSAANTYSGPTVVNDGTLELAKTIANSSVVGSSLTIGDGTGAADSAAVVSYPASYPAYGLGQLPSTLDIIINDEGLLDVNGWETTIGSLAGSGAVTIGTGDIFAVGGNNTSTAFDGVISGRGTLTKIGSSLLTLAGTNTYTGPTLVNGGTLQVNGSQPQSPVTVSNDAMLSGLGVVGDVSVVQGFVSLGANRLTCSNAVFSAASSLALNLFGMNAGVDYGQLNVRGTVTLSNGASLSATLGFAPTIDDNFTVINNDGSDPVSGTFSGLPEGATFYIDAIPFRISYTSGDGNDVVLFRDAGLSVTPIHLTGLTMLSNGQFQFSFTNTPGASFSVLSTTNIVQPASNWTVLPNLLFESPPGFYQFTDPSAMKDSQRYYRVRWP